MVIFWHDDVVQEISVTQFKATCLAVIDRVMRTGEPIVVTKHGKPAAIVSAPPSEKKKPSQYGSAKGKITIRGDIVSPLPPEFWSLSDGPR